MSSRNATGNCWNTIGVRGDRSCGELERHAHCRNCPVYAVAAQALLDRDLAASDLVEHARYFARAAAIEERGTDSVLIFRVGAEWLALPTAIVKEVADLRPIHSIPHRRGGALLGVTNVRGELVMCVSLARLLGVGATPAEASTKTIGLEHQRLLVLQRGQARAVVPADEVFGIHRVHAAELREVPATVGKATGRHTKAVIHWRSHSVGLLDERLVFHTMQRSVA